MTNVAILPEASEKTGMMYRAVSGSHQSLAKTAGAALDALTAQLPSDETGTIVIVQNQKPDEFFNAEQQKRLRHLMDRWRGARDQGASFSAAEQTELEALIDAEVLAAGNRAAALAGSGK